jgi:hypothetical protein
MVRLVAHLAQHTTGLFIPGCCFRSRTLARIPQPFGMVDDQRHTVRAAALTLTPNSGNPFCPSLPTVTIGPYRIDGGLAVIDISPSRVD